MTKKQVFKIIIFILLFIWLTVSLTYILRTNGDEKDRFTGFYSEKDNTIDAVIIGSSPVYPGYVTPKLWGETGITLYPLSTNMQRPIAGYYLVKEALKTQSPKVIIFEMRMYTATEWDMVANPGHSRGVTDNLKYSLNRIETINAMINDPEIFTEDLYTYYFDIFKYHSNWRTLFLWSQLRDFSYEYPDDLKGYVIKDNVGPSEYIDVSGITESSPIEDVQEEYLYKLLDYLKEIDQEALFIVTPYTTDGDAKQANYNYIQDIVESYGYNFLNMNNADAVSDIGLNYAEDFADYGNHLNAVGAAKVTEYLGQYLLDNYDFEDKRGQSEYSSWDDAYELYLEEYTEAVETIKTKIANEDYTEVEEGE
ncbi:MAG: SGNH/GDSL hydrolase family protein [Butyrivibrio sp.]|nr:SGNH/GDSL hydrolase family protein [Butyrivibrio sp.]